MSKTKFSISAASRITNRSRATILRHANAGKLSCEKDGQGNRVFTADELYRVYKDDCDFSREEKRGQKNETKRSKTEDGENIALLKEMQEQLIRQYVAQIDHLQQVLDKAQEGQNRVTKLLEDRSSEGNAWKASLDAMGEQLANKTEARLQALQERHDKEINQLKRILHYERKKSFWKKLFT